MVNVYLIIIFIINIIENGSKAVKVLVCYCLLSRKYEFFWLTKPHEKPTLSNYDVSLRRYIDSSLGWARKCSIISSLPITVILFILYSY